MSNVKGTVEQVSQKEEQGRKGKYYKIGLKIEGDWYNGINNKKVSVEEGDLVSFATEQNGEYENINFKSLKVSETAEAPERPSKSAGSTSGKGSYSGSGGNSGIKVGHAINNAVLLAIAAKDTSLKAIYGHAVDILTMSVALEQRFDGIVTKATEKLAEAKPAAKTPKAKDPEPEPEEVKPKAKPKAAAKKPEPEPEEPENGPAFDDDIPF